MLRITINNEEVCTDKNITINEEYLNTSNVILNDVHPKLWDLDGIYLNRFYHPKEYSKCKIFTTNEDSYRKCVIQGNTTQEQNTGSNYFDKNNAYLDWRGVNEITQLETGLRVTCLEAGSQRYSAIPLNNTDKLLGKTIKFSCEVDNHSSNTRVALFWIDINSRVLRNSIGDLISNVNKRNTFFEVTKEIPSTMPYNATGIGLLLYSTGNIACNVGDYVDFTNLTITIPKTVNYDIYNSPYYEEYDNNEVIPNELNQKSMISRTGEFQKEIKSKNLFPLIPTIENNGITFKLNEDDSYDVYGTAMEQANNYNWTPLYKLDLEENATYWLSVNQSLPSGVVVRVEVYNNNSWVRNLFGVTGGSADNRMNISGGNSLNMFIRVNNGVTCDIKNLKIQLEKGSQPTEWVSPKSTYETFNIYDVELNGIENVKDAIFYNEPNSEYYNSELEEKWYIKKNIDKITFNGSEDWQLSNTIDNSKKRFYLYIDNCYNDTPTDKISDICSTQFLGTSAGATYRLTVGISYLNYHNNRSGIYIYDGVNSTVEDFKTHLSENNLEVLYAMSTPEYIEITDNNLLQELNNYGTDLLFCGVVKNTGNINLNPRFNHFTNLQILDFKTFLSEGELSEFVIYEKTISEAIEMIINDIADYGVVLGNVNILNPDEIIGAYSTVDKSAYDVFNYLADISNARWTTRMIDENTIAVDFYDPSLMENGESIEYSQEYFEDKEIIDMTYSYSTNDYRNKQIITSNEIIGNILQSQTIIADGYSKNFLVEQKIGTINSLTVNGEPVSITIEDIKEMGYTTDFYYKVGNNYISTDKNIGVGSIIVIEYLPIINGRQVITEPLEISLINENTNRKGVVLRYENRNDATTSLELQKIGESYIKYKGVPEIILKVKSKQNIWNVGDKVEFTNAPLEELETYYMVKSKKVKRILPNPSTEDVIFYEYEMTSSFNAEKDINYFDNQRAKVKGNIGVGETINRNIDVENSANIVFFDSKITEVLVDGDNVLNSVLNSPFTK